MPKSVYGLLTIPALSVLFLAASGCKPAGDQSQAANNSPGGPPGPGATAGPTGPSFGPSGPGPGGRSKIGEIMGKVARGPMSLTPMLGNELKANPPDWATIQGQTSEYNQLASDLGKEDPPRGSKESWTKLTGEFADAAAALDKAAQAKDRDAALAAHQQLSGSCNACHKEHRPMRGPGGFPGGPPPGAPRGAGGPPGQ